MVSKEDTERASNFKPSNVNDSHLFVCVAKILKEKLLNEKEALRMHEQYFNLHKEYREFADKEKRRNSTPDRQSPRRRKSSKPKLKVEGSVAGQGLLALIEEGQLNLALEFAFSRQQNKLMEVIRELIEYRYMIREVTKGNKLKYNDFQYQNPFFKFSEVGEEVFGAILRSKCEWATINSILE